MQPNDNEQETIRRYLLGQTPPEQWPSIEERLLTDSQFYEELLIVEDELIDQYLNDELSQFERERFETHFLVATERRKNVRFSRTLKRYVATAGIVQAEVARAETDKPTEDFSADRKLVNEFQPKKPPFFSFLPVRSPMAAFSFVVAAFLVVAAVSWIAMRTWHSETRTLEPGNTLAVVLTPGLGRDEGETKRVSLAGVNTLQLRLALPSDEYQSYRAELVTSERAGVWSKEELKPESAGSTSPNSLAGEKFITLIVPAKLLKHDDYQVKLSGRRPDGVYEDVARYPFRAVK